METLKLEKEVQHKINKNNEPKNKIGYFKKIYGTIKNKTQQYKSLRIPELSIITKSPYQIENIGDL